MKTPGRQIEQQDGLFDMPTADQDEYSEVQYRNQEVGALHQLWRADTVARLRQARIEARVGRGALQNNVSCAQQDLGGISGVREAENDVWYGKYIDTYHPRQLDIGQVFEQYNLPRLSAEAIKKMTKEDREHLALHLRAFHRQLTNRINILSIEGNYEHPSFTRYELQSDIQAAAYASHLQDFKNDFDKSDIWQEIDTIAVPRALSLDKDKRQHKGKKPFVVFDSKNNKMRLQYDDASRFAAA